MTGPAWYPGVVQELLPNDMGGALTSSRGLVLHVQAGDHDPWGWFNRPDVQASSHWWVGKSGELIQYVPADRQAWAEADGNAGWHSAETEGLPAEPLTPAQIATLARLYAWGHATWGWPLQLADTVAGTGFGTHGMGGAAWGGHTGCPGPARTAQRTQILTAAANATGGDVATGDDLRKVLDEGTAPGQANWAGTSKATLGGVQTDINVDQADLAVDKSNAAALARIEALLGSLPGGSGGPLTAGQIVNALSELSRQDLGAVVAAGVQLLATPTTGGTQ